MSTEVTLFDYFDRQDRPRIRGYVDASGQAQLQLGDSTAVGAKVNPLTGGVMYFNGASVPIIFSFPDFSPSILASLVAGATATQSGNTVTITATAHGAVGSNAKDGYRFYYPGSASIAAGWYSGFVWVDVNTLRFTNPTSQTVGSESVNGGLAFTSQATVCSVTVVGGHIGANGECKIGFLRTNDTTSATKTIYLIFDAITLSATYVSTVGNATSGEIGFKNAGSQAKQIGVYAMDGVPGQAAIPRTIDTSLNKVLLAAIQVAGAGSWIAIEQLDYRITHRD